MNTSQYLTRGGIAGGWGGGWKPSSCLQTLIFEWKSILNFNPCAKFQTFRPPVLLDQFQHCILPRNWTWHSNGDRRRQVSSLEAIICDQLDFFTSRNWRTVFGINTSTSSLCPVNIVPYHSNSLTHTHTTLALHCTDLSEIIDLNFMTTTKFYISKKSCKIFVTYTDINPSLNKQEKIQRV